MTARHAAEAGAEVFQVADILSRTPAGTRNGKGEALWKSLAAVSGDLVIWLDSDVRRRKDRPPHGRAQVGTTS